MVEKRPIVLEPLFQELNAAHFAGELPLPRLLWNSRLSSSAGRFRPGSRNPLRPRKAEIEIASYLKNVPEGEAHIRDTMLHEMVHYYLWHRRQPYGHTPEFHRILRRVGAKRYNPVPKERPFKHWLQCPACQKVFGARRRIENSACLACCKKWNGGKYSARFALLAVNAPMASATAPALVQPAAECATLAPNEIIRRLEELKRMLARPKAL